jgi:hypothetical protein
MMKTIWPSGQRTATFGKGGDMSGKTSKKRPAGSRIASYALGFSEVNPLSTEGTEKFSPLQDFCHRCF